MFTPILQSGDDRDRVVFAVNDEVVRVVDFERGTIAKPVPLQSLMAHSPYWDDFDGDVAEFQRRAKDECTDQGDWDPRQLPEGSVLWNYYNKLLDGDFSKLETL